MLTSAAASTQTTILPTARTSLSMARAHAMPEALGRVHPRYLTPHVSTILMGVLSIVWYVGLTIVSENILFDSIAALGLMIAFYYGITGFACAIYYRRELLRSVKTFLLIGVGPTLGGLMLLGIFVKSCVDLSKPENSESGDSWFGLGPPLVIGVGFLLLGVVLMVLWRFEHPQFFRRRPRSPTRRSWSIGRERARRGLRRHGRRARRGPRGGAAGAGRSGSRDRRVRLPRVAARRRGRRPRGDPARARRGACSPRRCRRSARRRSRRAASWWTSGRPRRSWRWPMPRTPR